MKHRLVGLLLVMLMGIIPQAALAQDTNPGLPDGSNFLFLSTIIQKQDRPFAVPVPVIINGGVQAASGESAFCGEILKGTEVAASSSEGQCLAGPRIGLASSGYAVTNVGWQNFAPQGFGGNTTNVQPIAENESALVLGGIRFDVEPLDFGNTDVQMFRLRLSPQQSGVQPASTTQEVEGGAELFLRLTRMSREVSALHPLPVPEDTPVFPRISPNPSTLRFMCHSQLEGKGYWEWYALFHDIVGTVQSPRIGGWWGPSTNPLEGYPVAVCMSVYRYLGWDTILDPQFETWREGIMKEEAIPLTGTTRYEIPAWSDDQFGGHWTITIASMGAGAFMFWQYVNQAGVIVTNATNAVFMVPTRALECSVNPSICTVKNNSASAAELPSSR